MNNDGIYVINIISYLIIMGFTVYLSNIVK